MRNAKSLACVLLGPLALLSAAAWGGLGAGGGIGAAPGAGAGAPAGGDPNRSGLSEARKELGAILKLIIPDGNTLALDRESWNAAAREAPKEGEAPANVAGGRAVRGGGNARRVMGAARQALPSSDFGVLLQRVREKTGSYRAGLSPTGAWASGTFDGGSLECLYKIDEVSLELVLRETGGARCVLHFRAGPDGALNIVLLDAAGDAIAILLQDAKGAISVTHIADEKVNRAKAANYKTLCKEHSQRVDSALRPALEAVGITLPLTPWSEPVRQAILETLKAPGAAAVANLLAKLDSDKAPEREVASKRLSETFLASQKELKAALDSPASSAEVKARIQDILRQNRPKLEPAALIESLGLLRDAELLADMLKNARSDEDKKVLSEALDRIKK